MPFDEEYFKSDDFQELLHSYEASVASGDTMFLDADDFVDIADYYNYNNSTDKAIEVVEQALELYPDDVLLNVFMARQSLLDADFDMANEYAERIGDKEAPDYHYLVAEIMIAQGRVEEADKYLRKLYAQTAPDEVNDFIKDVGNLYVDYNVGLKAYEWMSRLTDDNSDDFKELMARALFGVGKYKEAERLFNELLDNHPYSKSYWTALASAQFMSEDYGASVTSSEFAIAIDPEDPEGIVSKANALFKLGNNQEALRFFQRYDELVPDDPLNLLHQGACLVNMGRNEEALEVTLRALQCVDDDCEEELELKAHICQELAFCYSALNETEKALEMIDKTTELPCDHNDMLVIKGHILLEAQRIEEAQAVFAQAIYHSDGNPSVYLRIITSLYDNRYVKASYRMLKKLLGTIAKDYSYGYSYLALCCWDLGQWDEFLVYLHEAVERNANEARMVLGRLFPDEMPVEQYETYIKEQLEKTKQ